MPIFEDKSHATLEIVLKSIPLYTKSVVYRITIGVTFMSLQELEEVCVGKKPITCGLVGSVMSTNEDPSEQPAMAYSPSVSGSVQPQMSLPTPLQPRSCTGKEKELGS